MRKITYYTSTTAHLSIEDYTNEGLKQDDIIKRVESIVGVVDCRKAFINHNIDVDVSSFSEVDDIVNMIKLELEMMLTKKRRQDEIKL